MPETADATDSDYEFACPESGCERQFDTKRGLSLHQSQKHTECKQWRNESKLRELYLEQDLPLTEIADRLGCDSSTVGNWLKRFGIETDPSTADISGDWQDKETLRTLYHEEGMSSYEIAEYFGVKQPTIHKWMKRHDIESRSEGAHCRVEYAALLLDSGGYMRWVSWNGESYDVVHVHRLLAIAEHGFDRVCGMDIHHENKIPFDNRPENIEVLSRSEHTRAHAIERVSELKRDELGQFVGMEESR